MWLNTLLYKNTSARIVETTNPRSQAEYIHNNCNNALRSRIEALRGKLSSHCVKNGKPSKEFLEKWNKLEKLKWTPDIIDALDEILNVFEDSSEIVVPDSYKALLDKKEGEFYKSGNRFSEDSIKKIKEGSENNMFKAAHAKTFIRYAMIPYFSLDINKIQLKNYLMWIKNPDNLLGNPNDYFQYQINSILEIVEDYITANGYSFEEAGFFNMMRALFIQLTEISDPYKSTSKKDTNQRILENVKKTYRKRMVPNADFDEFMDNFAETLAIYKDELENLIDEAAYDTLKAYRTYCNQFKEEKMPSWDECTRYSGFCVQMLYYLYSRLWQQESQYLQGRATDIRDDALEKYNTFIHHEAIIAPTVFIKENCIIEKAEIQDNVRLSNCTICDGVIIEKGAVIDPSHIIIGEGMRIKSETTIEGTIVYTKTGVIIQGKFGDVSKENP